MNDLQHVVRCSETGLLLPQLKGLVPQVESLIQATASAYFVVVTKSNCRAIPWLGQLPHVSSFPTWLLSIYRALSQDARWKRLVL